MSEPMYTTLPEDLVPLPPRRGSELLRVSVAKSSISFTKVTYALIGNPERVALSFGAVSRMMALRPSDSVGYRVQRKSNGQTMLIYRLLERLGVPLLATGRGYQFEPQLVDGCLLIGPFPKAEAPS